MENISQSDFEAKTLAFWRWGGDGVPPKFTHWTADGVVVLRIKTPNIASEVVWRPRDGVEHVLGNDDCMPLRAAANIRDGKYDKDANFPISKLVPEALSLWNNFGG